MILSFLFLSMLLSLFFFLSSNPLTLGLILIFMTIMLSIMISIMATSSWFLYLIILVFIGGMLVLFIYVTSIFPNQKFFFNQNILLLILGYMCVILLMLFFLSNFFNMNINMSNIENIINMKMHFNMINTNKIFSSQTNLLFIFLVNYLFYCMIVVIKITNYFLGPLRMMNYV